MTDLDAKFNEIWELVPRKEGRKMALRHFRASVKTEADFDACKRAIQNYAASVVGVEPRFVKMGSTLLYNWEDYVALTPQKKFTDAEIAEWQRDPYSGAEIRSRADAVRLLTEYYASKETA